MTISFVKYSRCRSRCQRSTTIRTALVLTCQYIDEIEISHSCSGETLAEIWVVKVKLTKKCMDANNGRKVQNSSTLSGARSNANRRMNR